MTEQPTVLVTGGCGYIGSHVSLLLSQSGYRVVVLDNLSTGFKDSLLCDENLIVGDVGDQRVLTEIFSKFSISAVLHFAASLIVEDSVKNPLAYYQNNTAKFIQLLRAATAASVKHFIFSSTAAVYGNSKENQAVAEDSPTQPENPYGRSKLMDEWILRDVAYVTPLKFVTLRYFNVAGADSQCRIGLRTPEATHLIKVACETAVGKKPMLSIFGGDYPTRDGTCIRDYIHVEDLAEAHLAALRYLEQGNPSTTLNCGYGEGYSVKEVVSMFKTATGIDIPFSMAPRRAGDPASIIANNNAILRTLDWRPRRNDLGLIIRSALAWEQKTVRSLTPA